MIRCFVTTGVRVLLCGLKACSHTFAPLIFTVTQVLSVKSAGSEEQVSVISELWDFSALSAHGD